MNNTYSEQTIAIIYHSGYGHTQALTCSVAKGVENVGANSLLIDVANLETLDWDTLASADAMVFGSPTYMGSVSAPFKAFMDASSNVWYQQGWKNKLAAGFTTSASYSGDKLNTLIQMSIFAAQHGMIWVGLGMMPGNSSSTGSAQDLNRIGSYLGMMGQSNSDEDAETAPPHSDHLTAIELGKRVAQASTSWTP